ncbi:hypothetical protein ACMD2_18792 [Ananas comosus]|uniref:Uncharacterized protein n=1 Tax=Ananas comosus TaxID=4615 RepID=A0A199VYV2_ANACO|nr:hypothetical protein ACMD2_18792 [Ananas comosus]
MEDPLLTLPTTTTTTSAKAAAAADADAYAATTPRIVIRMLFVAAVAAVSLWAHREASRSFGISVVVADPRSTPGRRFALAFASNGRAERLVHRAGRLAHRALYPDPGAFPPKPVRHVTLHVAPHAAPSVGPGERPQEYVIYLDPLALVALTPAEADAAVSRAVRRAVARVLMWDPPEEVADAVADYVASAAAAAEPSEPDVGGSAGASCWSEGFVRYCEARREGFVARLNREARARWSERAVESALGEPLERACAAYRRRRRRGGSPQPVESGARSTSASQHATSAL